MEKPKIPRTLPTVALCKVKTVKQEFKYTPLRKRLLKWTHDKANIAKKLKEVDEFLLI
jgi:hypothetical protein